MHLGPVIRRLREEKGWSQEELAHRIGTTAATLSRVENQKHGTSEAMTNLLSKVFECRVYELYALAEGVTLGQVNDLADILGKEESLLVFRYRKMKAVRKSILLGVSAALSDED